MPWHIEEYFKIVMASLFFCQSGRQVGCCYCFSLPALASQQLPSSHNASISAFIFFIQNASGLFMTVIFPRISEADRSWSIARKGSRKKIKDNG